MLHLTIFSCNTPSVFAVSISVSIFHFYQDYLCINLETRHVFMSVFINMNVMLLPSTFHSESNQVCFETDVTEVLVVRAGEFSLKVSS